MNKWLIVAQQEYKRNVFKKSFILVLLSVPFFIVFSLALGITLESLEDKDAPVGYVDHAGIITIEDDAQMLGSDMDEGQEDSIPIFGYETETLARAALDAGEIQGYYVITENYMETRKVDQYAYGTTGDNAWREFYDFLQANHASDRTPEVSQRLSEGSEVIVRSVDGRRIIPAGGPTFGLLMPLFITMGFLFMLLMSSGYAMSAIAEEKENLTMEVLATTLSPGQLVGGKIVGILAISVTLLVAWTVVIVLGVFAARGFGVAWLNDLSMDWSSIFAVILIALPAYALATALMTAVGAMVTSNQEGQSVSSVFLILHLIPMYISFGFIQNPHGVIAVVLTLLPFTALMTLGMRNLFTIVPTWQIALSALVQLICAGGAVWLAGRALRMGMLRTGQRLSWKGIFTGAKEKV